MTDFRSAEIDLAVFKELQDTAGAEFTAELVGTFLDEAPSLLAQLSGALAQKQTDTFRRTAHSLKTNALTFGAQRLAEMARALELSALDAVAADTQKPLDTLAQEYAQVALALADLSHAG